MSAETVARTIQLILAPVVMVTACAILLGGLLSHYAAINERLRALARERLDLLRQANAVTPLADPFNTERLQEIDQQIPDLLHRHRLERDAILSVYGAVLVFLMTMLVIAAAAVANSAEMATAALIVFLAGTGALSWGVWLTAVEVRRSHLAVEYEARRVEGLGSPKAGMKNVG